MICHLAFTSDGKTLASAIYDNNIVLYDAATGQQRQTLPTSVAVRDMRLSSNGQRLAVALADGTIQVWSLAEARVVRAIRVGGILWGIALSPDGQYVGVVDEQGQIRALDTSTGKPTFPAVQGHASHGRRIAFSPDGGLLVTTSLDKTVRLWDAKTGAAKAVLRGHGGFTHGVAFSPDGKRLASAGTYDQTIRLWDVATSQEVLTLRGHTDHVEDVTFSPDGKRVVSAGWDGTVKVWDATRSGESVDLPSGHISRGLAFSPDGTQLAVATDNQVRVWDATTGEPIRTLCSHSLEVHGVAWAADRLATVSRDQIVRIWDAGSGRALRTLRSPAGPVTAVAFSPDALQVATASEDQSARVWEVNTGRELFQVLHSYPLKAVAFSPDGRSLATASGVSAKGGELKVWEVQRRRQVLHLNDSGPCTAVAFSRDGRLLAYGAGRAIKVWDLAAGREVFATEGHPAGITSVAFSPDGSRLAIASTHSVPRVWDLSTGTQVLELKGHTGWVYAVAFSPDGRRLASTGDGYAVKLWDAGPPVPLARQTADLRRRLVEVERRLAELGPPATDNTVSDGRGFWRIDGQELVEEGMEYGANLVFGDRNWTDVRFELEAQAVSGTEGFGFALRATDPGNGYWFFLGASGNQVHVAENVVRGQRVVAIAPQQRGTIERGRWYKVGVEAQGRRLRCWLDGQLLFDCERGQHVRGAVGLRTWTTVVRFRRIKVMDLDGKILFEDLPRVEETEVQRLSASAAWLRERILAGEDRCGPLAVGK